MKIVVKVNEDKELVSIHCSDADCEVVLCDYHECVVCGDATEWEMDREFQEETEGLHQILDMDTYWDEYFDDEDGEDNEETADESDEDRIRRYIIGCLEADEDIVEAGLHENEDFVDDVIDRYESNLDCVCDEYSEINAKDDAIAEAFDEWV